MTLISLKVFPKSVKKSVLRKKDGSLEARFSAVPEKGKANKIAIDMVAEFLGIPASRIKIIKGARERNKLISIDD
jgi:hypothetical protein